MAIPEGKEGVETFICDATIDVKVDYENEITDSPVSDRSRISSHAYNKHPIITINGVVSGSFTEDDFANNPQLVYDEKYNQIGYDGDRVQTALRLLKETWQTRNVFTINSALDVHTPCVMKSFNYQINVNNSSDLEFKIVAKQIRLAEEQRINITVLDEAIQDAGSPNIAGKGVKKEGKGRFTLDDSGRFIASGIDSYIQDSTPTDPNSGEE